MIQIEKVIIKSQSRKLGGLQKQGRSATPRKNKRSFRHMTWRFERFDDGSFVLYRRFI